VIDEPVIEGQGSPPTDVKVPNWRVGPARLWYDQIGLSTDAATYDYGFKLKSSQTLQTQVSKEPAVEDDELTGNKSLPVNLIRWEDEIIYDSNVLRDKLDLNTPKIRYCGWVPTTTYRSLATFQKSVFGRSFTVFPRRSLSIGFQEKMSTIWRMATVRVLLVSVSLRSMPICR
jgi:hypothetical protein